MKSAWLFGLLAVCCLAIASCSGGSKQSEQRVVVFGVDGLDPDMLLERLDDLPNFKRVLEQGTLYEEGDKRGLQTSWPPQSPVAWSNFSTGVNPGKHGLFDFIHVDRKNYGVANSMSHTDEVGMVLSLFGFSMPLTGGEQHLTRDFPAFWEVMDEAGIPVAVHRMPANFPPQETGAVTFPDMGTPDLLGAASGHSFLWTNDNVDRSARQAAFYSIIPVDLFYNGETSAKLFDKISGPPNSLIDVSGWEAKIEEAKREGNDQARREAQNEMDAAMKTSAPFAAHIDFTAERPQIAIEIDGEWGVAELGGWTGWIPVEFKLAALVPVTGYMRFLFKSADPFELYGTPLQIDPFNPVMPVSTPDTASADLADAIGPYYTQGFPDAYIAYKSKLLTTPEFISQSDTVFEERGRMLDYALDQFDDAGGLLFFYTGSLDLRCHMLWHCQDSEHPHQEEDNSDYADQIDRVYKQVDGMLGDLLNRIEKYPDTTLIIMSDHGFAPFRRKMHVNDWLLQEGYLVLKDSVEYRDGAFYQDEEKLGEKILTWSSQTTADGEPDWEKSPVDWSKTKAYCIGFNGVILNREGREPLGIVTDAEADALLDEIQTKLLALRDNDVPVFSRVPKATEVFHGKHVDLAPDLQLGFAAGFGASDECATGEITGEGILVDNDSRWSGSHLMDPEAVRGTILVNKKVDFARDPRLEDVTATLYSLFQVAPPEGMDGEPLF